MKENYFTPLFYDSVGASKNFSTETNSFNKMFSNIDFAVTKLFAKGISVNLACDTLRYKNASFNYSGGDFGISVR